MRDEDVTYGRVELVDNTNGAVVILEVEAHQTPCPWSATEAALKEPHRGSRNCARHEEQTYLGLPVRWHWPARPRGSGRFAAALGAWFTGLAEQLRPAGRPSQKHVRYGIGGVVDGHPALDVVLTADACECAEAVEEDIDLKAGVNQAALFGAAEDAPQQRLDMVIEITGRGRGVLIGDIEPALHGCGRLGTISPLGRPRVR